MATDDFNRADSTDLGANWSVPTGLGALQIVSNRVRGQSTSVLNGELYAGTFANDQYAQVVLKTVSADAFNGCGPAVRMTAGGDGYVVLANAGAGLRLLEWAGGAYAGSLGSYGGASAAVNDVIRIEAEGTAIRVYQNGNLRISTTDATIASGSPGAVCEESTLAEAEFDDWDGGNLFAAAISAVVLTRRSLSLGTGVR
jgi:hypothetical protein